MNAAKRNRLPVLGAILALSATPCLAQKASFSEARPDEAQEKSQPSALTVSALELAGDPALSLAAMTIDISVDRIVYSYGLKNSGAAPIALAGAIEMPSLEPSGDLVVLPRSDAENPVDLMVALGEAPLVTTPHAHANALGLNRIKEIKSASLPDLPFGAETEKAIAQLPPEVSDKLTAEGLLTPRDPADPNAPRNAAWKLDVTHALKVNLPPGRTVPLTVSFAPIKASYRFTRDDLGDLDGLKDDMCLSAKALSALRGRITSGGQWEVTEISVDADAPNDWMEAPKAKLSVKKPRPDSIVAFCGVSDKGSSTGNVAGSLPEDSQDNEIHIMIFTPAEN